MSEDDRRQFALIVDRIIQYESGNLELGYLVRDIEALLNTLQDAEQGWRESAHEEWWTLEQVYAVALDRGQDTLTTESKVLVDEAITNLKALAEKRGQDSFPQNES